MERGVLADARWRRFAQEYVATGYNGAEAVRRSGYTAKHPADTAKRLKVHPTVKKYIEEEREKARLALLESDANRVAPAQEVLEFFTGVMRGEYSELAYMPDGQGSVKPMERSVSMKDRLRSAEALAKRWGLMTDKMQVAVAPVIVDDLGEESEEADD